MQYASDYNTTLPPYMHKLECGKNSFDDIADAIKEGCEIISTIDRGKTFFEFELRFGQHESGFMPGVKRGQFYAVERRLDSGRDWAEIHDWHYINAYQHPSSIAGDVRKLRTEIIFGGPHGNSNTTIYKELVSNFDYKVIPMKSHEPDLGMRIAFNLEHKVTEGIPDLTEPTCVHRKERKCYYYTPTNHKTPVWCYVLTKRWVGKTYIEAYKASKTKEPTYEIELECVCMDYLLSMNNGQVATKFLYKACDIIHMLSPGFKDYKDYMIEPFRKSFLWRKDS